MLRWTFVVVCNSWCAWLKNMIDDIDVTIYIYILRSITLCSSLALLQDGLTGSAWGDWANYTASPLRWVDRSRAQWTSKTDQRLVLCTKREKRSSTLLHNYLCLWQYWWIHVIHFSIHLGITTEPFGMWRLISFFAEIHSVWQAACVVFYRDYRSGNSRWGNLDVALASWIAAIIQMGSWPLISEFDMIQPNLKYNIDVMLKDHFRIIKTTEQYQWRPTMPGLSGHAFQIYF